MIGCLNVNESPDLYEKWSEELCFSSNANQVDKCLKSVGSSLLISLENIMKWPKVDTWCMFKGMY